MLERQHQPHSQQPYHLQVVENIVTKRRRDRHKELKKQSKRERKEEKGREGEKEQVKRKG